MSLKWSQASWTGTGTVNSCDSSTGGSSSGWWPARAGEPAFRTLKGTEGSARLRLAGLDARCLQDGAAGEHGGEGLAVVGVAVEGARRVSAVASLFGSRAHALLGARGAREGRLGRRCPYRRRAHVGEAYPRLADRPSVG